MVKRIRKTQRQIQKDMRDRRRAAGWELRPVWMPPEVRGCLARLRARHETMTVDEIVAAGLVQLEEHLWPVRELPLRRGT